MRKAKTNPANETVRQPHRVHLPGFVAEEDTGLGDVIKRVTYAMGIKPCSGCQRRAAALNRWVVFTGIQKKKERHCGTN